MWAAMAEKKPGTESWDICRCNRPVDCQEGNAEYTIIDGGILMREGYVHRLWNGYSNQIHHLSNKCGVLTISVY